MIYNTPNCIQQPAVNWTAIPPAANPSGWPFPHAILEDGIPFYFSTIPPGKPLPLNPSGEIFFKFYAEGRCNNFSIASYKNFSTMGDAPLLVSVDHQYPRINGFDTVQWFSAIAGDKLVDVAYCNPNPNATYNVYYIGVVTQGFLGVYSLVATTQRYFPPAPLSSFAYSQPVYDLAYGALPTMTCDKGTYNCTNFQFSGCTNSPIGCCYIMSPLPAEENPQPFLPWNPTDNSVGFFPFSISWTDVQPLVPGKLVVKMEMSWSSSSTTRYYNSIADPSTCRLTLGQKFVDRLGAPVVLSPLSFQPKNTSCDYDEYLSIINNIDTLMKSYLQADTNDVRALALQQVRIVIATFNDVYAACQQQVQAFTVAIPQFDYASVYICGSPSWTPQWFTDPCCNPVLGNSEACLPSSVAYPLPFNATTNSTLVSDQCANSQCSLTAIDTYIDTSTKIESASSGCLPSFSSRASLSTSNNLLAFITTCQDLVEGPSLQGRKCSSSADCWNNASCLPDTRLCNHTSDDVLNCLATGIDRNTALNLFNIWGVGGDPTVEDIQTQFAAHWIQSLCVGPYALDYRKGFRYTVILPSCQDTCLLEGMEPYCEDVSKWNTPSCVVPTACIRTPANPTLCSRNWLPLSNDLYGCSNSKICNWRNSTYNPCPPLATNCESLCVNSSLSFNVCLDCSQAIDGACLEMPSIIDEGRCNEGWCTANDSITDPVACSNSGTCSLTGCPTCNDKTTCEASGVCSDQTDFHSLVTAGRNSACILPKVYGWLASLYPGYICPTGTTQVTIGCLNASITTEANCSALSPLAKWYSLATNASTCSSSAGFGCYSAGAFTLMNSTECALCQSCVWKPYYTWSTGVWTQGYIQPLQWQPRQYYSAAAPAPAVDYSLVSSQVEAALSHDLSSAYYTDGLCRYDSVAGLTQSVLCDCGGGGDTCFAASSASPVGTLIICPYQAQNFTTLVASIYITDTDVPVQTSANGSNTCQNISIAATSVGKYQVPPDFSVTHPLFSKIQSNAYLVVTNSHNAVVGQLISDAATIALSFVPTQPILFCMQPVGYIDIDPSTVVWTIAKLQSDNTIQVFDDAIPVNIQSDNATTQVCGYLSDTGGTFFAVAVLPNWQSVTSNPSGETIASFVLYLVLLSFAILQAVLLLADRENQRLLSFKLVSLFVVVLNACVRAVYILPPKNSFGTGTDSIQFLVYELPTFLYFSVFTVIEYLWLTVILRTKMLGNRRATQRHRRILLNCLVGANVFMYAVFVVFIYLLAILPEKTSPSPCYLGNLDSAIPEIEQSIRVAYWTFQMVVSVLLSLGFIATTGGLLYLVSQTAKIRQSRTSNRQGSASWLAANVQLIIITVVAFVCVVFLLVRCILFLDVAINRGTLKVIVFCVLEVIPQAMLVFYLHPFRCFTEASTSTTKTKAGSTQHISTGHSSS